MLNTYELMQGVEKYVVSGAIPGLRSVVWTEEDQPRTDGSTIYLPRPNAAWDEDALLLWRYKAEHELGHEDAVNSCPHWREVMVEKKKDPKYKDDGLLWWISNLISDHVQEHNRVGDMIGRDTVLYNGRAMFLKGLFDNVVRELGSGKEDATTYISCGLFYWDTRHRMSWNDKIKLPSGVITNEKVKDVVDRLDGCSVDPTTLKNEMDVFNAAVIIRKLFDEIPPQNGKPQPEDGEGEGEGKGESGKKKVDGKAEWMTDKARRFTPSPHMEGDEKRKYKMVGSKSGGYTPRIPIGMDKAERGRHTWGNAREHENNVRGLIVRTNLPAKVRAFLMAMKREKWDNGFRSGKLDTSRLTDALRRRDDLFRRKEEAHLVNSAVSLLVDASGSMGGHKFEHACASACMLAEALQGIGVNVEIAGFTEACSSSKGLIHDVWLPFGRRYVRDNVLKQMGVMSEYLLNNADGENILYAYNRLKNQKEARKILIVLSDGAPAAEGPAGATMGVGEFTKKVIKDIEKDKRVHLVGIGIGGHDTSFLYKNSVKVEHHAPLEPALLEVVKNAVIK